MSAHFKRRGRTDRGQNFFKVFEDQLIKSGDPDRQFGGGHRVWLAPEDAVITYAPDNAPVQIEAKPGELTAAQPVEPSTGRRKQLAIRLAATGSQVEVIHRIENSLPSALEISARTATMMAVGGIAVTGFPATPTPSPPHQSARHVGIH